MKKIIFLLMIISTLCISQNKKTVIDSFDYKLKKIYGCQYDKDILELGKLLIDKDKRVAARASIALANLQDTITIPLIIKVYQNSEDKAKKDIAFSLGQIGPCFETGYFILSELKTNKNEDIRNVLFEALGKSGQKELLDSLILIPTLSNNEEAHKIMGIARYALRGIKNSNSIKYLVDKLKQNDENIFTSASYALWRSSNYELLKEHLPIIFDVLEKSKNENKYYLINALSAFTPNDTLKNILFKFLNGPRNVQLSTIKALEKYPLSKDELEKISYLENSNDEHVKLTYYRFLQKVLFKDSLDKSYIANIIKLYLNNKQKSWREKAELFSALAVYQKDSIVNILIKELESKNERYCAKIINAIGDIGTPLALQTLLYKINPSNTFTKISLLENISKIRNKVKIDSSDLMKIKDIFLKSLYSKNIGIITTAVMALNNNQFRNLIPLKDYIKVYNSLKLPDDVEGILQFIRLLAQIGGDEVKKILEYSVNSESDIVSNTAIDALYVLTDEEYIRQENIKGEKNKFIPNWKYFDAIVKSPKIEINTEKGKILVQLFPEDAPYTVMSICSLADRKFFDGLVFHRVVPNFVIQGGDPLGTGWGGPGYSIKTEISPQKFGTGYLGMANAGKNTEGSQFFITHSPQPHLDGRYTVFGKVIKGMDVVDLIQEGDKIISIRRVK